MPSIDLNCDLGESFGAYTIGMDAEILPYVTSANIACGFHAGDPSVMQKSVLLCKKHGVQVGAHPRLPDLQGFGRRRMAISPAEAEADVMYQIGALKAFCDAAGVPLHHVKPHGALYNMAARDQSRAGRRAELLHAGVDIGRFQKIHQSHRCILLVKLFLLAAAYDTLRSRLFARTLDH